MHGTGKCTVAQKTLWQTGTYNINNGTAYQSIARVVQQHCIMSMSAWAGVVILACNRNVQLVCTPHAAVCNCLTSTAEHGSAPSGRQRHALWCHLMPTQAVRHSSSASGSPARQKTACSAVLVNSAFMHAVAAG